MPTKEEKIEYIRQKCIEANPSIKDLVFGCQIKQKYSVIPYTKVISGIEEKLEGDKYVVTTHGIATSEVYLERYKPSDNYILEILGREIRLADVLLAINKVEKAWLGDWVINSRGHFVKQYINGLHVAEAARYNFLKDSLSDQDEACIDFLYELLHG